jgi:ribonuclease HII
LRWGRFRVKLGAPVRKKPAKKKKLFLKKDGTPMSAAYAKMCLLKSLKCTLKFEKQAWQRGAQLVAGVDEVGRGCLFGPVVAAAVILDHSFRIRGLRDSKLIEEDVREKLAAKIRRHAIAISISVVDVETIDRINIYHASRMAMTQAVAGLNPLADHLLIDAMTIDFPSLEERMPQTKIIHGDALSVSIAAASIIAKVERDRMMRELAPEYPHYDIASNKGYSAPKHLAALREIGPTPLHRMSFAPVWTSQKLQDSLSFMAEASEPVISGDVNVEEILLTELDAAPANDR